jgi:hypothetical protein
VAPLRGRLENEQKTGYEQVPCRLLYCIADMCQQADKSASNILTICVISWWHRWLRDGVLTCMVSWFGGGGRGGGGLGRGPLYYYGSSPSMSKIGADELESMLSTGSMQAPCRPLCCIADCASEWKSQLPMSQLSVQRSSSYCWLHYGDTDG